MTKTFSIALGDKVAEMYIKCADDLGVSPEDLLRDLLNRRYAEQMKEMMMAPHFNFSVIIPPGLMTAMQAGDQSEIQKQILISQATAGILTCHNCTMRLTPDEVEKNECNSCHAAVY
jgi:uncharacterized paraquat-inducible protein A